MKLEIANVIHKEFKRLALADALKWLADASHEDAQAVWRAFEHSSSNPFAHLTEDQLRLAQVMGMVGYNVSLLRLARLRSNEAEKSVVPVAVRSRR